MTKPDPQLELKLEPTGAAMPPLDPEALAHYRAVLETLSPRTREVFLLSRVDGLNERQIARALGMWRWSVRRHMVQAMAALARGSRPPP